ncbi:hypothetical protein NFI95_17135 [Acetobacteraceae bacterium KSS8]|uniref:Lipoprotein n=1 Tax=Endosaccharibacter trunci TaxID=2812733 RepID=A0ABT1WBP2_9PROT|nr:hypothetical protein [Acetobacteraceae bacterium KSS8]
MRAVLCVAVLGLAGCVGPSGPVIGDWRGAEQSIEGYRERVTELIIDGRPGDGSGVYHLISSVPASGIVSDPRDIRWSDRWQKRLLHDPSGAPYTVYHLDHAPPSHLADYVLLSTGALLPVVDPAHPDTRPESLRIALQPLSRTAYGYGRP